MPICKKYENQYTDCNILWDYFTFLTPSAVNSIPAFSRVCWRSVMLLFCIPRFSASKCFTVPSLTLACSASSACDQPKIARAALHWYGSIIFLLTN